ncbi:MAG: anaerobic dehydrogenase, typically selenocysteine-containing, partial [Firmicutes bacterium]|nr:anaerobic dehydrogenase, typically selenocysteine-containing [Bacillota bacterium]
NEEYLSSPNLAAARGKGFNSWTNAAQLVVDDPIHPNHKRLVRPQELGLEVPSPDPSAPASVKPTEYFTVVDRSTGQPARHDNVQTGDLFFNGEVTDAAGKSVKVKTAFVLLKESVFSGTVPEYAKICGVPEDKIVEIATELSGHGTKTAVDGMGNTAATNGFDAAFAQYLLSAMTGSVNKKGGMLTRRNSYKNFAAGPRYNLAAFANRPASKGAVQDELKKVERVPLIIALDAFMGETTALADYIIPDTTPYESWGLANTEGSCPGKVTTLRWPVVQPLTAKLPDGRFACFENYVIDVAKRIGLPGFGDQAIQGADKKFYPLHQPADYFLKAAANAAFDGDGVPDLSEREAKWQALDEATAAWKNALTPQEWPKVSYLISRGGRFEEFGLGFKGDNHNYPYTGCINIYVERLAMAKNSFTGKPYSGTFSYTPECFADGTPLEQVFTTDKWPFKAVSYKAKFRSISMLANTSLRNLNKTNAIEVNPQDAEALGLKDGQKVKLIAATGGVAVGLLKTRAGIARGTVAVAFGYGHWEYGARAHQVDGKSAGGDPSIGTGVNLASISLIDPKVKTVFGYSEMSTGTAGRNGGAFRIEKA